MQITRLNRYIPTELQPLVLIKIFTTYSFAVLYSSLILYMNQGLGINDLISTKVAGVFISFNFLLHLVGGYGGGKFLSNRALLALGMLLELAGLLVFRKFFYIGLGIFLTGCGVYVSSINAIMLQLYEFDDNKRESASFWLYSAMNLGFFIGHSVSGYYHLKADYSTLFDTALLSSLISLMLVLINWHRFKDTTTELSTLASSKSKARLSFSLGFVLLLIPIVVHALSHTGFSSNLVLSIGSIMLSVVFFMALRQPMQQDKNKLFAFLILVFAALVFWSLFFIGPMGLTIFIKEFVQADLLGITIPPQWFHNINTIIIVFGGPILAAWFKHKREQGKALSTPLLFSLALLFIGAAFAILPVGIYFSFGGKVAMLWIIVSYILQTLGELFLSPIGIAMIAKLAPKGKQGLLLGLWMMVSGIASTVSNHLSQLMVLPSKSQLSTLGINAFSYIFNLAGWAALLSGLLLLTLVPLVNNLINSKEDSKNEVSSKEVLTAIPGEH